MEVSCLRQSTPGSSHHGVLRAFSRSRSLLLDSSSSPSSNSSCFLLPLLFLDPGAPSRGVPLPPADPVCGGGDGDASKEMKSSCPSNCARDVESGGPSVVAGPLPFGVAASLFAAFSWFCSSRVARVPWRDFGVPSADVEARDGPLEFASDGVDAASPLESDCSEAILDASASDKIAAQVCKPSETREVSEASVVRRELLE